MIAVKEENEQWRYYLLQSALLLFCLLPLGQKLMFTIYFMISCRILMLSKVYLMCCNQNTLDKKDLGIFLKFEHTGVFYRYVLYLYLVRVAQIHNRMRANSTVGISKPLTVNLKHACMYRKLSANSCD